MELLSLLYVRCFDGVLPEENPCHFCLTGGETLLDMSGFVQLPLSSWIKLIDFG